MNEPVIRPVEQLLSQVFDAEQRKTYADLSTYLESGGSIFPLVERGVRGLVRDYQLQPEDAQAFLRRANALAVFVRRQFIEHTLRGSATQLTRPDSGLLSMVNGPSFEQLFSPGFGDLCPPQALESIASPVAYLIELLRWIRDWIFAEAKEGKLDLHDRRQDLKRLQVDFSAVHQSISALDIIVPVLETFIEENKDKDTDLEDALITARYPNGLPYYQHWVTLDFAARQQGMSVGNFAHMVDLAYPYFLQPEAWDNDAGRALSHASRLGPYQRELLTQAPTPDVEKEREAYYLHNFGAGNLDWQNLNQVPFFGERTRLSAQDLEALLSIREFAPTRSAHVTYAASAPLAGDESQLSGSVYLNAAESPALSINFNGAALSHRLTEDPVRIDRYERMNRKLRLDQWLGLPPEQVDALLVAAINAEKRGKSPQVPWWISTHTVHAVGLFQSLRERYDCPAEDFAAFIDDLSLYGRGPVLSLFDRTFNSQGSYRQPLLLDKGLFTVLPGQGVTDLTVSQLCSGLNIDLQTYAYLAVVIARAHELGDQLTRTPEVISSFYRLVKLPRLLGITPVEGGLMLTLLGGENWLNGLAGKPRIIERSDNDSVPDALNLIYALHSCVSWCRERDLPVQWVLQQVSPLQALAVASEAERSLFEQLRNLLPSALFSNAGLQAAGVPLQPGLDWLHFLGDLVDASGLIVNSSLPEADYLNFAREKLDQAIKDGLGEVDADTLASIGERMLNVLLQAREAQVSVARECLTVYTGLDAERALRVLSWAQSSVYQLLSQVLERAEREALEARASEQPDPLLSLLADLRRRSAVVSKLDLSARLLEDFLQYGHKAWIDQDDRHLLSMRTLYYLSVLTRAFEMSQQPADKLLDYLRQVHALPGSISVDALRLAQQAAVHRLAAFFDWSVQEVRECVSRVGADDAILKTLSQLDLLMRIRVLAEHSGMDALTIFLLGTLPETVDKSAYAIAAERALLSISETRTPLVSFADEVPEPLVSMTCTVDKTEVVANKPADKIVLTVTLKDAADKALKGVYVYWQTTLGTVATSATNADGVLKVDYVPGKVMGREVPLFWLDLIDAQQAPPLQVLDDSATLDFPPSMMAQVPVDPVPAGLEVELYASLRDNYQNPGRHRPVRWNGESKDPSAVLVFRPVQSQTDAQGVTRVFVSSPTGGEFTITALSDASNRMVEFDAITFLAPTTR
ncbi:Tc toxin subunit A [Pseudomonas fluorescens]|uniref:Tc toxin subunit A n=1 Tax=Pseudomonas fluorescens TaxID=294 RepID=UPI0037FAA611